MRLIEILILPVAPDWIANQLFRYALGKERRDMPCHPARVPATNTPRTSPSQVAITTGTPRWPCRAGSESGRPPEEAVRVESELPGGS